jgi:hypothetical protein
MPKIADALSPRQYQGTPVSEMATAAPPTYAQQAARIPGRILDALRALGAGQTYGTAEPTNSISDLARARLGRGSVFGVPEDVQQRNIARATDIAMMAAPIVKRQAGRTFSAPQDEALRLAQERAALPVEQGGLGLPPNNTAEQRAKAMGFDTSAYHGTVGNKKAFEKNRSIQKDSGWYGNEAVYTTVDPNSASSYANWQNIKNNTNEMYQQNVIPLLVRQGKVFEYGDAPPMATREEADKFTKIIRDNLGYDTVVISNKYAAPEYAKNYEMASFNPDNIRSRFAAFDPFRRNAATAAAMGVAAPDLLAKEKNK